MPDILDPLNPVADALEQLGISYCIGGSVASSAYGLPRSTVDIDIVAEIRMEHARPLTRLLKDAYYIDEDMIKDAVRFRSGFNVIHNATSIKVDIFLPKARPFDRQTFQHIQHKQLDESGQGRLFSLSSPEDVILNKLEWYRMSGGSERQWSDVQGVLKVQGSALDFAYMRRWATEIGVADLLERALQQAGE